MEEGNLSSGGKRRRTEKEPCPPPRLHLSLDLDDITSFDRTAFPQILAAAINVQNPSARSLVKRFLHSLTRTPSLLFPRSFLSLLPLLLASKYPSVACLSLEAIGVAALCSYESNAMIASDEATVKGLVWALGSKSRRVAVAACDAVMDVATSPVGRETLRGASAVEKLL